MADIGRSPALADQMLPPFLERHLQRPSARFNAGPDVIFWLELERAGQRIVGHHFLPAVGLVVVVGLILGWLQFRKPPCPDAPQESKEG